MWDNHVSSWAAHHSRDLVTKDGKSKTWRSMTNSETVPVLAVSTGMLPDRISVAKLP